MSGDDQLQATEGSQPSLQRRLSNSRSLPILPSNSDELGTGDISHATSSSKLTSSDKLSALPVVTSSPALGRYRSNSRAGRASGSASSLRFDSPRPAQTAAFPLPTSVSAPAGRASSPEGSFGRETPRQQRVSFESDHVSLPTLQSLRQVISSRLTHSSDPDASPAAPHHRSGSRPHKNSTADSPSVSPSRATSPLRFLPWPTLHRAHSREEPFIPVDPFKLRLYFAQHHTEHDSDDATTCCLCLPFPCSTITQSSLKYPDYLTNANFFIVDTLPRIIYLHLLLRLPSLYFSRVARIFEDAEVSRPDIQRMVDATGFRESGFRTSAAPTPAAEGEGARIQRAGGAGTIRSNAMSTLLPAPDEWNPPAVSPALARFKRSWEEFIGSLLKEWKTLNVVSALLLTAILTMFQIPDAAADPLIRTAALISLVCALMSLSYGCIFIIRFGTMGSMYRASRWAEEAQATKTSIWWNVWVMLAMPAVWLTCPLSPTHELGPRIVITCLILLGLLYFWKIIGTFRRYSSGGKRKTRGVWSGAPAIEDERRRRAQGPEADRQREIAERGRERQRAAGLGLDLGLVMMNGEKSNGEIVKESEIGGEEGEEKNEVVEFVQPAGSRASSPRR
ncbi:hypothetical protein NEOLEDRAFT_1180253 [Neolentinus lepideus HHB14362 ss-1]|uniref:Uncharacterized protein n=1 Tax=Neolentinus lepideus HHB14362 ss-1 TaxID=1314782 RepID=A0A165R261_9AGAM|nr:hypothetical protein NEOLEDRAFT_1180253 [Neolentinus lepideus HHB14362 ss-1]